jgi:hypothetical protein
LSELKKLSLHIILLSFVFVFSNSNHLITSFLEDEIGFCQYTDHEQSENEEDFKKSDKKDHIKFYPQIKITNTFSFIPKSNDKEYNIFKFYYINLLFVFSRENPPEGRA